MESSAVLTSHSSCLRFSYPMMRSRSSPPVAVPLYGSPLGVTSFAEFKGLRAQMGYELSSSLASAGTRRRNAKVSSRIGCETQDTVVDIPTVTGETWQSLVFDADGPMLVEFWAPWCGPYRIIHPVIAELSTEYNGKLRCFKSNTDECPSTANKYEIRSIPTIMIFNSGEKKDVIIGAVPKTTLISNIEKFL